MTEADRVDYAQGPNPICRFVDLARAHGLVSALRRTLWYPPMPWNCWMTTPVLSAIRSSSGERWFRFQGETYAYAEALTERAVELPLVRRFLSESGHSDTPILEVGNVLGPWGVRNPRVVLDKFEHGDGITNVDVIDYWPATKFPIVVSISTLEHVGFDEPERDPSKFRRAISHLLNECLAPGGRAFITLPLGYNPIVDEFVCSGVTPVTEVGLIERVSGLNAWREVYLRPGFTPRPYDFDHHTAQVLAVLQVGRQGDRGAPLRSSQ